MTAEQKNMPVASVRNGSMSIAVFDNAYGKSVVLQKGYKKKDSDEWVNSSINLFMNELVNLKALVDEAYTKFEADIKASQAKKK